MNRRRAYVSYGGWEGHQPEACAEWTADLLHGEGFKVQVGTCVRPPDDRFSLIVPVWSLADAPETDLDALVALVFSGVGLAAFHGAAATFHRHNGYRRLIGGTFVWHPDEAEFAVELRDGNTFLVETEQYYLHVDPANDVVARTVFPDGTAMPVAWRRRVGAGRVFYSALGHSPAVLSSTPVRTLFAEGALWAAGMA